MNTTRPSGPRQTTIDNAARARELAAQLDGELAAAGEPTRARGAKAYLKSPLAFYGVTTPVLRALVRTHTGGKKGPGLGHDLTVALTRALWVEPVFERRAAALEVLVAGERELGPADLPLLEELLRDSGTWALIDGMSAWVVAPLLARHPAAIDILDRWIADPDPWLRRAALLALLPGLRRGGGDWERFSRYADQQLADRVFWITKAIGWVLREVSKRDPERVATWLLPRATRAGAVTVREAVKYLPAALREPILATRRRAAG